MLAIVSLGEKWRKNPECDVIFGYRFEFSLGSIRSCLGIITNNYQLVTLKTLWRQKINMFLT